MKRESTDEWAHRAEEVYRSTWQKQGHGETASFIRAVCAQIVQLIHAHASSIEARFRDFALRTQFPNHAAFLKDFQLEIQRLEGRWQRRLESEALDLEEAERRRRHSSFAQSSPGAPTQIFSSPSATPKPPETDPKQKPREVVISKVQNPQAHTILSIPEAALYFEVQSRTIHRWKDTGELKSGARRGSITIESILAWQKKRSRKRRAR
jgi:hypothetical protein